VFYLLTLLISVCLVCVVFGHWTEDCDDDQTYWSHDDILLLNHILLDRLSVSTTNDWTVSGAS